MRVRAAAADESAPRHIYPTVTTPSHKHKHFKHTAHAIQNIHTVVAYNTHHDTDMLSHPPPHHASPLSLCTNSKLQKNVFEKGNSVR